MKVGPETQVPLSFSLFTAVPWGTDWVSYAAFHPGPTLCYQNHFPPHPHTPFQEQHQDSLHMAPQLCSPITSYWGPLLFDTLFYSAQMSSLSWGHLCFLHPPHKDRSELSCNSYYILPQSRAILRHIFYFILFLPFQWGENNSKHIWHLLSVWE